MVPVRHPAPRPRPSVLVTGFDAFGGDALNPSWLAVQALRDRQIAGHRVVVVARGPVLD